MKTRDNDNGFESVRSFPPEIVSLEEGLASNVTPPKDAPTNRNLLEEGKKVSGTKDKEHHAIL